MLHLLEPKGLDQALRNVVSNLGDFIQANFRGKLVHEVIYAPHMGYRA